MYGDGLCWRTGRGSSRGPIDGWEVLGVKMYQGAVSEVLHVGYDPAPHMTERDYLYLEAHDR